MVPEEITPLVPAVMGEKVADDQTCYILETLLKYMVIQVITICNNYMWKDHTTTEKEKKSEQTLVIMAKIHHL